MGTSTTPPPPKHGGSGPFIAAAVVMLLLMGGLVFWKFTGDDEKPAPPPAPVATAAPPMLEEAPPPPPPIEEVKDAGVEPKQPVKRVVSGSGGCSGECKGTEPGGLRGQLSGKAAQARGCYERALRQNAQLQGRMKVSLRIGPNGSVCSANVTQNEVGDPGVATCVLSIFRTATFAAPQGGCVDAEVPLRFEPKT